MGKKALIAMSGGVDSSVAALLMKEQGYECIGVTMQLIRSSLQAGTENRPESESKDVTEHSRASCSSDNIKDAQSVAEKLHIPYEVVDYRDDFKSKVMDPFVSSYLKGWTPNPCIECNRHLKFAHLYRTAVEMGCDVIATGHYARIVETDGVYRMLRAVDGSKDQSYVLYSLPKEQLGSIRFPLGAMTKEEVRRLAEAHGFINATRKDSQDICFIPDGDYRQFMAEEYDVHIAAGDFIDRNGKVLGQHKGYHAYTIGQRKGLGIAAEKPYYVVDILPETNQVVLGANEDLFAAALIAEDMNWLVDVDRDAGQGLKDIQAKVRYRHQAQDAAVEFLDSRQARIVFREPQRAITKGQAVVLYRGEQVLGGGTIVQVGS